MDDKKEREPFEISLVPYNLKIVALSLYKDTYQLLLLSISVFIQSQKIVLLTLCDRAINIEIDIINLVINAYKSTGETKLKYLNLILDKHLKLYTILKLIIDNSKICQQNASRFVVLMELIGKQTNGWINSYNFQ